MSESDYFYQRSSGGTVQPKFGHKIEYQNRIPKSKSMCWNDWNEIELDGNGMDIDIEIEFGIGLMCLDLKWTELN